MSIGAQPKLRTSCDACGATKVKCDRAKPRCGRCVNNNLDCFYGISRKHGRGRRVRPDSEQQPATQQTNEPQAGGQVHANMLQGGMLDFASLQSTSYLPGPTQDFMLNDDPVLSSLTADMDPFGQIDHNRRHMPFADAQFGSTSISASPALRDLLPFATTPSTNALPRDPSSIYFDAAPGPAVQDGQHDCTKEAHQILGDLSFPPFVDDGTATGIPLDRILRLNRTAGEHLARLLTCTCTKTPNLTLLHASSLSLMLLWYQRAGACTQAPGQPWSPVSVTSEGNASSRDPSRSASRHGSVSHPVAYPSLGMSTTTANPRYRPPDGGGGVGSGTASPSPGRLTTVSRAKMVVGSFDVDDPGTQLALQVQLVLAELVRASNLINLFTASHQHSDGGQNFRNGFLGGGGGVEGLYQSLDSWLLCEHAKVTDSIRARLRQLNA